MSQLLITNYLKELAKLRKVSGTHRETVVREAFKDLLKAWARSLDLTFIPEYDFLTKAKELRYVDGALLHTLRVPFGYWEAKDEKDDLDAEIDFKLRRGYPTSNIIFEDSTQAVLIQHGEEVMRCGVEDTPHLERLLNLFFGYERPEIEAFRKAVDQFKTDLPAVLEALRAMIERAYKGEAGFRKAANAFLTHAQEAINPNLVDADVREMLIQHILTGEVFAAVFPGTAFHEDNSVARELHKLEATFFTGNTKHQTLKGLAPYYTAIRKAAAEIAAHHEKQTFLKAIYENFYKAYNPKAADRLGVIYTPNEIVRFMIASADWLCEKHFGRSLIDKDVDILDPATGTGTFICELIEHFAGQPDKLRHKYQRELHANEVAILPYYVANLNIEATYAAAAGRYEEFPGLCFVDTLDNTWALRKHTGHIDDLFGSVTDDNIKRIRQQNSRRISVIIGNPPYNANQLNENENNKNREYPEIDKRIKETYVAASSAQKTKLYDMYARFFRWATDRLDENGVLAFVTNRSFIDSRTFDGFRAVAAKEFNELYVVDLGGDIRGGLPETRGNVFGIRVGVAVSFFVKKRKAKGFNLHYSSALLNLSKDDKLAGLSTLSLDDSSFAKITPTPHGDWFSVKSSDFESQLPVGSKSAKSARPGAERTVFKLFSLGAVSARDEWVYGRSRADIEHKVKYLIDTYNLDRARLGGKALTKAAVDSLDYGIKWTRAVKADLAKGVEYHFERDNIIEAMYRPFSRQYLYFDKHLNEMRYKLAAIFGDGGRRTCPSIVITDAGSQKPFMVLALQHPFDYHIVGAAAAGVAFPLSRVSADGTIADNITDWALNQFKKQYLTPHDKSCRPIGKQAVFHYVYAVLHDSVYREKFALNLKREFPRIPFYPNFWQWANWGKALMELHIGYESVAPFALKRTEVRDEAARKAGLSPKVFLKADMEAGRIRLDSETILEGIPDEAWNYKLGNRSALEWILDQYKEKTPKDPTIRERFNTYRFADYKEKVIDLLARVTTVSVRTVEINDEMLMAKR
ncbi:MAG: type ISP restriction/modification enzyme [Burkholderiales bacterium]